MMKTRLCGDVVPHSLYYSWVPRNHSLVSCCSVSTAEVENLFRWRTE